MLRKEDKVFLLQNHLKLYNIFQCLANKCEDLDLLDADNEAIIATFSDVASKSTTTHFKDAKDRGFGQQKIRFYLQEDKESTNLGRKVAAFEGNKTQHPIFSETTPDEVEPVQNLHKPQKQQHHDFYYYSKLDAENSSRMSIKGAGTLTGFLDRGYGVHSPIKGHLRCSNSWKAQIHGVASDEAD
ncbi:hypothetical protein MBANPS3_010405 [Mucor bainieri]